MKSIIDVFRSEKRFLILSEYLPNFLAAIGTVLKERVFSERQITQTIYFNNDDYSVPWGHSIKARRYLPSFSQQIVLNPENIYRAEIKTSKEKDVRAKIQEELPLKMIPGFIADKIGLELRPYAVVEYLRTHFVSRGNPELLRLTVDRNVKYGFFEEIAEPALWLSEEDFGRIELKADLGYLDSLEYLKVKEIIAACLTLPVISKRLYAFYLIKSVIDKKSLGFKKELKDCEIEGKFLVRHQNPAALLLTLKNQLLLGLGDYQVADKWTFTQEGASINHYWARQDENGKTVEGLKILMKGSQARPVFKKETKKFPLSDGRDCILVRKEVKAPRFSFTKQSRDDLLREVEKEYGNLEYIGHLVRSRKSFYPQNNRTGRIFHVSIDRNVSFDGRIEWQLEVEYVGRYLDSFESVEPNEEKLKLDIRNEVTELSQEILFFCNKDREHLIPTTLTKFDWLRK